jgi:hypothetical protein
VLASGREIMLMEIGDIFMSLEEKKWERQK